MRSKTLPLILCIRCLAILVITSLSLTATPGTSYAGDDGDYVVSDRMLGFLPGATEAAFYALDSQEPVHTREFRDNEGNHFQESTRVFRDWNSTTVETEVRSDDGYHSVETETFRDRHRGGSGNQW